MSACAGVLSLFTAWEPTKIEIQLLNDNPKRRKVNGNSTIGRSFNIYDLIRYDLILLPRDAL